MEVTREPVLVTLSVPARRDLVEGLVCAIGTAPAAPILDLDVPDARIADFLAGAAHSEQGFVARTCSGQRAVAIVAATAAALCGDDIRAALESPDIAFLSSLKTPAVQAVRSVLLAVETGDTARVLAGLSVLTSS